MNYLIPYSSFRRYVHDFHTLLVIMKIVDMVTVSHRSFRLYSQVLISTTKLGKGSVRLYDECFKYTLAYVHATIRSTFCHVIAIIG